MSNDKVVMSKDTIWSRIVLQWVKGTRGGWLKGVDWDNTLFSIFKQKKTIKCYSC